MYQGQPGSRSPNNANVGRKVFNLNQDTQGKYEEMKVQGTLESSDEEEDDYDNPFGQAKDKKVLGNN